GREHFEMDGLAEGRLGVAPFGRGEGKFFGERAVDVQTLDAFRAEKFPYAGPYPWLDRPDWPQALAGKAARREISPADAKLGEKWARDGYIVLEGCIAPAALDRVWAEYEAAARNGVIHLEPALRADDPFPERYLDPHLKIPALCSIMRDPEILRCVRLFMEREPAPFQTIMSHKGSEQGAHSDTIHMTTYPLGYLTAAWIAFEDINPDCGPLVYYPGSHRLPYVFSKDVGIPAGEFGRSGYKLYHERYEPEILRLLEEHHLAPSYFHAKKGDVLIWHANLIHGGSPRRNLRLTRKAMVAHYFVHGAVTYHDLSGKPAQTHSGTCLLRPQRD
ncbi:MAG: phytanoyl-CoA dioxygenase family protein, partial [Opitutaceae bacterium]